MVKWHKSDLDNRMYCNAEGGKKISMPRYYKDRIYNERERKRVAFFSRIKMVERQREEEIKGGDTYWRDKAENDKAAFRRMNYKANQNQKF